MGTPQPDARRERVIKLVEEGRYVAKIPVDSSTSRMTPRAGAPTSLLLMLSSSTKCARRCGAATSPERHDMAKCSN